MVINGMNRKKGEWRVEHYAYGYHDGLKDWHLMIVEYFQIGPLGDPEILFNISGTWSYTESNTWSDCNGGAYKPEIGSVNISKVEDIISMDDNGLIYAGTINNNKYTLSASYPDNGGIITIEITFNLTSDRTGSGTVVWEWADSNAKCNGGHNIALTREAQDTSHDEIANSDGSSGSTACFLSYCLKAL